MKPYDPAWGIAVGRKIQQWTKSIDPLNLRPFYPLPDVPSTYEGMRDTMNSTYFRGFPYPVYSVGCETSIYGSEDANHAFRFMHDWVHVRMDLGFDLVSEMKVAEKQLDILFLFLNYAEDWVFRIDTQGQALYSFLTDGEFLKDQAAFVQWVYEEARRLRTNSSEEDYNDAQILQQAVYSYYLEHKQ
ncbi:hypothetical protein UFOVP60_22 [uncultured Caudovirales phage]|uniref:Uncharacterized protein n=1 Tax=uncultured Caudovirales phage TaxID=2100421 RepID=A0A6J5T9D3_9CAUD|nr:hypothetical protein UFOVP60_22 [uncultured Caudovirales phage]